MSVSPGQERQASTFVNVDIRSRMTPTVDVDNLLDQNCSSLRLGSISTAGA